MMPFPIGVAMGGAPQNFTWHPFAQMMMPSARSGHSEAQPVKKRNTYGALNHSNSCSAFSELVSSSSKTKKDPSKTQATNQSSQATSDNGSSDETHHSSASNFSYTSAESADSPLGRNVQRPVPVKPSPPASSAPPPASQLMTPTSSVPPAMSSYAVQDGQPMGGVIYPAMPPFFQAYVAPEFPSVLAPHYSLAAPSNYPPAQGPSPPVTGPASISMPGPAHSPLPPPTTSARAHSHSQATSAPQSTATPFQGQPGAAHSAMPSQLHIAVNSMFPPASRDVHAGAAKAESEKGELKSMTAEEESEHNQSRSVSSAKQVSAARRASALTKFREKKKSLTFEKKVRYVSRKKLAESRPRIRGQFVKQETSPIHSPGSACADSEVFTP
eukprot:CAMPEP_0197848756 /NCGR_PEP_ID=MMETSP1438-20131217/9916_1 /TAXON_ID=1461541 /ORGANISM="Pterosperma sp., Strain CCMP1384" /LENGTH=384 /DNA_ID=CAMNT_0043461153 /DNA_START=225 /DNA_END=1379 /DNA_ORIENTATION=+